MSSKVSLRKFHYAKGRQAQPEALSQIQSLIQNLPLRRDLLIEYLHLIQDTYRQISTAHLCALAQLLKIPQSEAYEVATFYHHFDVVHADTPEHSPTPADVVVRVCDGVACEMAGSTQLMSELVCDGSALSGKVRVIHTPCVGRCAHAPVAVVHQSPVHQANAEKVLKACQAKPEVAAWQPETGLDQYLEKGGYQSLQRLGSGQLSADKIIDELSDSALRGLGGAGFPAGKKWRIVREQAAPRLMAVNIDEGEPGTFKDRYWLENNPHQFIEGMLIAAKVVGIDTIYVYLRDEYHALRGMLSALLEELKYNPPCQSLPNIELRRGAGAYICGEESAMIESIEGKRGMPRLRPPYVASVGLFGRPTLEHNMETLYWVPEILRKGGAWFASQGRHGRKGLRAFSVSGRVKKPGVHLAPAGITLNELLHEYCDGMLPGHELYGYLPGGASGGILPARLADVPLDFDTLQTHGCFIGSAAIVVFSNQDSALAIAKNLLRFFKYESCGQCTPCREGSAKLVDMIEHLGEHKEAVDDLMEVMREASICGLGQAAPNPVECVMRYFPQEVS